MSMVVSYKKQVVLGILLLVILLGVVELFANIWLFNIYKCEFEDNELFEDTDKKSLRKICLENIGLASADEGFDWIRGTQIGRGEKLNEKIVYINSEGFRGPEFTKEKPENTIRIFTVGGSTTFGAGVMDHQTWPAILQQKFDEIDSLIKIEVINVGRLMWDSIPETNLIRNKLLDYEPDIFFVYDGVNDARKLWEGKEDRSPLLWKERWAKICELTTTKNIVTIITLQPMAGTGERILTQPEIESYNAKKIGEWLKTYPLFKEKLKELDSKCTKTEDYTKIFDDIKKPIFYDGSHTGFSGNKIIADNVYETILPFINQKIVNFSNSEDLSFKENTELKESTASSYQEIYYFFQDLLSQYKTPKVINLIFE